MVAAIKIANVSKKYGHFWALDSLSLTIKEGEYVAVLGPNGAGKTTLIKMIATHVLPSSGVVEVYGRDAFKNSEDTRRRIGFVAHESFLYDELSVEENMLFYGNMFFTCRDVTGLVELLNLRRWYKIPVKRLSHGLRKRADIARALIHNPDILLLDELFTGIDEKTRRLIIDYFRNQERKTLLISSHSVEWATKLCDRGIFLERGRLRADERF